MARDPAASYSPVYHRARDGHAIVDSRNIEKGGCGLTKGVGSGGESGKFNTAKQTLHTGRGHVKRWALSY